MNSNGKLALVVVMLLALVGGLFAFALVTPQAKADGDPFALYMASQGQTAPVLFKKFKGLSDLLVTPEDILVTPNCAIPAPAPACTAGNTICIEGDLCHATLYTCGTTGWGVGSTCSFNSCNRPGVIGGTCS
jgi:hypothetical protein